jgi:hypothetical protein
MSKSKFQLSDSHKIAFAVSCFFIVNVVITSNLDRFNVVSAYIVGFSIGIASAFFGFGLHKRRKTFVETDGQIEMAVELCKQLSVVSPRVIKSTPAEVAHIIYASKAFYAGVEKTNAPVTNQLERADFEKIELFKGQLF